MKRSIFGVGGARVQVSALGLGCSQVGSFGNPAPDEQVRTVLRRALDLGVTVFDTADIYGQGDSEREIGRLLRGRRDEAFVITKFGKRFSPKMRALAPLKPLLKPLLRHRRKGSDLAGLPAKRDAEMREDFSPARFASALNASLRRLGGGYVDAVLLHSPPVAACREPAVWEALQGLQTAGKARCFGVSCDDLAGMEAAAVMPGLSLIQAPLDVFDAAATQGLTAALAERGVGLFVREVIRQQPALSAETAVVEAIARPGVTCAIVGTSRPDHLERLAAACL